VQYLLLWASGAPNSRAAPKSPHSSYATAYNTSYYILISFVVQDIMLYNSWQFSFCTISRRGTQHQQNTALQAMQSLSITLCQIFWHPRTQLSHIWRHWLTKSPYLEGSSVCFFRTSQLSSNLAFRSPKVHAHSHVKQNH